MNREKQHKLECFQADCKYAELQCLSFHGNECKRLGGHRIPLMRNIDLKPRYDASSPTFKPYFMNGGTT